MSVRSSRNLVGATLSRLGRALLGASLLLAGAPLAAAPPAAPAAAPAASPAPAATVGKAPAPAATAPAATAPATAATTAPASPAAAVRPSATEVVKSMQKVYDGTSSLKASFSQTLSGPMGKRQASGVMVLKKPGMMRWDYLKPEKKLFVADGKMLWMYEPEDEQAFSQPLSSSQLPAQVSFLFGKGQLLAEFDVSHYDGPKPADGQKLGEAGDYVLKLVPKKATAQYKHLVFVVSPTSHMVKETVLFDQQGGTNHLVFGAIEPNPKAGVDDSRFSFTPPVGTKIINPH